MRFQRRAASFALLAMLATAWVADAFTLIQIMFITQFSAVFILRPPNPCLTMGSFSLGTQTFKFVGSSNVTCQKCDYVSDPAILAAYFNGTLTIQALTEECVPEGEESPAYPCPFYDTCDPFDPFPPSYAHGLMVLAPSSCSLIPGCTPLTPPP